MPEPKDARALAARVVTMVTDQGNTLDTALEVTLEGSALADRDRALLHELSYGTLRWYHRLASRAVSNLNRPIKARDRDLWALLLVGLYQLEFMRVPSHAAVDSTVRAAKSLGKPWARGLLNAVLRNADRAQWAPDELSEATQWAHPDWLYRAIAKEWPQHARAIVQANNNRPPMTLRVNQAQVSRDEYLAQLQAVDLDAWVETEVDTAITLDKPVAVDRLPGFDTGLVSVQDISAQRVAALVAPEHADRVLDACSAPGGKCAHLLERYSGIELEAVEVDAHRLVRLKETLNRLQLTAKVTLADATQPSAWWDGRPYQRILIDAPCSGSGVIRRHPDIKHLRRADDIADLVEQQGHLLDALWSLLDPRGVLVYATCSILRAENDAVIGAFLRRTPGAAIYPVAGIAPGIATEFGYQALPGVQPGDGFYYARLRHKA